MIGLPPDGGAVAQDLGRAILQPRGQFRFVLAVGFVGFWKGADRKVFSGKGSQVPIFIALGIPDHSRTPNPLAQYLSLVIGRCGFVANAGEHH